MGARRFLLIWLASLCGVAGGLTLASTPALALSRYPLAGQLSVAVQNLESVATNGSTGDVLISETLGPGEAIVQVVSSLGDFGATWTGLNTPTGQFQRVPDIAVNDSTGDVYVADSSADVIDVFNSSGSYLAQITHEGVPGGMREPFALTVDQASGDVYVADRGDEKIDVFDSSGGYLSQIPSAGAQSFGDVRSLAFDDATGYLLVADSERGAVYELEPSGGLVTTWTGSNTPQGSFGTAYMWVAADNASGDVYVADGADNVVDQLTSAGVYVNQIQGTSAGPLSGVAGLTVSQISGDVYVPNTQGGGAIDIFSPNAVLLPDVGAETASGVGPASATLEGTVNPDGLQLTDCHFDYGTNVSYGHSAPCVPPAASISADSSSHTVTADLAGLQAGTTYHFRLVASNANGVNEGQDMVFSTPPPPTVGGEQATNLTASSADLGSQIDPNGFDTTYHFEWGETTSYGRSLPTPDGDVGAGLNEMPVSAHLSGLAPGMTYHWRVIARNANGTTTGVDHSFIYDTSGNGLPDGRAYEMVTPPQKNAALIGETLFGLEPDISRDGSRIVLQSIQCFDGSQSCSSARSSVQGQPYEFTRTGGAWVTTPWEPPADQMGVSTPWLVSADAGTALFSASTAPAGEDDFYAREPNGSFAHIGPMYPPAEGTQGVAPLQQSNWQGTADLSHIVWDANKVDFWPFDHTLVGGQSLYEYAGTGNSGPQLIAVSGGFGSTDLIGACDATLGGGNTEPGGSLSADGRTVFFTVGSCSSGSGVNAGIPVPANEVYARIDESHSVLLSGRSPDGCLSASCLGSPSGDARFAGASVDGSKAFFTSTQQLVDSASEDSSDSALGGCAETTGARNGCNLYEYDFAAGAGRSLIDVSAGDSSGGGPRVRGVLGLAPDGSHVYFIAGGVLSTVANSQGQAAHDGADNLYVYERDAAHPGGHVSFIAVLSQSDEVQWNEVPWGNVTPDGRFLVFTSHGLLTRDDSSLSGASQVFRYDAVTGELLRMSIGDRGFDDNGNRSSATPCSGEACSENASIVIPRFVRAGPRLLNPTMSDDGSYVFFRSPVGLTSGALDDVRVGTFEGRPSYAENVYEYHDGRVFLISDGRDTGSYGEQSDVQLAGTDASGRNVFFTSSDRLVGQDTDSQIDYYDARICSSGEPCLSQDAPQSASCEGEACRGEPAAPPQMAGSGTSAFAGPGNLVPSLPAVVHKKPVVKKKRKRVRVVYRRRGHSGKGRARSRGAVRGHGQGRGRS